MNRGVRAFSSALALEVLALGGGLYWLASRVPVPALQVVPLVIEAQALQPAEPVVPPAAIAPPPTPAAPRAVPSPPARQQTAPMVAPAQSVAARTEPAPASEATAFTAPVPAAAAAPPPAPPAIVDPRPEYNARVKSAVQAAVVYPPAAAALNFRGRARVEFVLRDGQPGQARVVSSSGMGLVDRAALQSVQNANYPAPPAALRGHDETYQIWVEFNQS